MTTNNVQLPTESMIVAGFEAVSMFHDTDAYKQMTGCQGAAESARICWAAMVAAMPAGETPRQDVAASDAAILSTRAEAAWARYGDEADIEFGRNLLSRFGLAAMPADAWQPIETAPKNTEVLVWREDSGPFIAKLTDPYEVSTVEEMERGNLEFPDGYEEWWSDAYGWQEGSERPTHWVPLPAAPGLQSQEYTAAIGGAGQAYLDRFKNAHALPAEFRWSELWAVMCAAANMSQPGPLQSQDREPCSWPYDESDGAHQTSCGNMHIIIDGTPEDNGMKYCCYCGGRITPAIDHARRAEGDGE